MLRPFALADAPRVAELCGDWDVARMTSLIPHPYSLEIAESFIGACRERYANGPACTYAIARADDGLLVGAIGITSSRRGRRLARLLDRPAALGQRLRDGGRARHASRSPSRASTSTR